MLHCNISLSEYNYPRANKAYQQYLMRMDRQMTKFLKFLEYYADQRAKSAAYRVLNGMSDYQLKDMGISRCEIKHKVYGPK